MNQYQKFIHISRYARWIEEEGRRETWLETVQRYIDFFDEFTQNRHHNELNGRIKQSILGLKVMPSMRALMTAGEALKRENLAGFNCSYMAIDRVDAFKEALYLLMCGVGVGFSCETKNTTSLPRIATSITRAHKIIVVEDSKEGWADALGEFINDLYTGTHSYVNYKKVRKEGERLKVFGGRSSGAEPLKKLFKNVLTIFKSRRGLKLRSIDIHDLMCMIGEVVVVGGVRRSALISLSNLKDSKLKTAKKGNWWEDSPHRSLANISTVYTRKPSFQDFLIEWGSLVESRSGERGIFNREASRNKASRWGRRTNISDYGCNPCSEIILKDRQLCNLSEVIVSPNDGLKELLEKVEVATILGTMQSALTGFANVSPEWSYNTAKEALLGVSLTGIMDNDLTSGKKGFYELKNALKTLRVHAREINRKWAKELGVNPSAAITCVKPSGTVSQLCDTSSGIHPRHSKYYLRTVRVDKKDPLYDFMKSKGFSIEDDVTRPKNTAVISFPMESPQNSTTREDLTAIESLEMWKLYDQHWCEHKPSVTISVKDYEWENVGRWVYTHFDEISGVSFLPFSDHSYKQAPYQDLTKTEFNEWVKRNPTPSVDWLEFKEEEDNTTSSQELACSAGGCEVV